jgi:hypothetical protein
MGEELSRHYSDEEIELGLQAAAKRGPKAAAAETGIPYETLRDWAYIRHRDRYQLIKDARQGEAARELATQFEDNTRRALELQAEILNGVNVSSVANRPEEATRTAANLSKVAVAASEKMQVLRDRPDHITAGPRTIDEIDASFIQRFGKDWAKGWDVESTAEEITDQDQDPPSDAPSPH